MTAPQRQGAAAVGTVAADAELAQLVGCPDRNGAEDLVTFFQLETRPTGGGWRCSCARCPGWGPVPDQLTVAPVAAVHRLADQLGLDPAVLAGYVAVARVDGGHRVGGRVDHGAAGHVQDGPDPPCLVPGLMETIKPGGTSMVAPRKYPEELRERSIRMTLDTRKDPASRLSACRRIGEQLGINPETLRGWVTQAEVDAGARPGTTTAEAARLGELEREVRELRRANAILRSASVFFAAALDRPSR